MTEQWTPDWFAVQVWAGREHAAAKQLMSRGYDVFLPRYREHRQWSDRVQPIDRALFEGYVFCRLDGDIFGKLLTARHVIRLVGDGKRPLPVAPEEMQAIRTVVGSGLRVEPWPVPQIGRRVRIGVGPLAGIEGVVVGHKGQHRLIVQVSLLQRAVAVELDTDWLDRSPADLIADPAAPPDTIECR